MASWQLPGPRIEVLPARVALRVEKHLQRLRTLVSPRVQAACFSTVWNRWCTARRFGQRHSVRNRCLLGCAGHAEDSLQHYFNCEALRWVAAHFLRLGHLDICARHLLMEHPCLDDDETLTCVAVLVYAAYFTTNHCRNHKPVPHEGARDALQQACRNLVQGHANSARVLDCRWMQPESRRRRFWNGILAKLSF